MGDRMKIEEFINAVSKSDFQIGDTFWLDDIEFEVVDMNPDLKRVKTLVGD